MESRMTGRLLLVVVLVAGAGLPGSAFSALPIQHWSLENGAKVFFVESRSVPILDLSIEFDAGGRRDPEGKAGLASQTNAMLATGIREARLPDGTVEPALTEAQVSDVFADIAAQRGGGAGEDRAGVTLRTLSGSTERDVAVTMLARLLAQPGFPAEQLARDKARTIASIKEDLTKPESIAHKAFWKAAYGAHPYAYAPTVESVESVAREDLLAFHARHYVANRAVIAMIGAISRDEADAIARQLTKRLPQGQALAALPAVVQPSATEERIAHPASQAHILMGVPALVRGDPDFFALSVGNYVLGGGAFVSRLTGEVRVKRGLAYSTYSYFSPMLQEGPFQIGLQTQKEQAAEALKVVRATLEEFLRNGPSEKEVRAAKDNLIGGFSLRIDNNRKILDHLAMIAFYNLPLDYLDTWTANIKKVTLADIKTAFKRKLAADRQITVVVGPQP
jgi:zinc protease